MTARHLIADLVSAKVQLGADGFGVNWSAVGDDPPESLLAALAVLHTGVRAVLTGRRWYGFDAKTGKACGPKADAGAGPLAFGALDPSAKLPPNVGYLCVEGDAVWDRIDASTRDQLPHLFVTESGHRWGNR